MYPPPARDPQNGPCLPRTTFVQERFPCVRDSVCPYRDHSVRLTVLILLLPRFSVSFRILVCQPFLPESEFWFYLIPLSLDLLSVFLSFSASDNNPLSASWFPPCILVGQIPTSPPHYNARISRSVILCTSYAPRERVPWFPETLQIAEGRCRFLIIHLLILFSHLGSISFKLSRFVYL